MTSLQKNALLPKEKNGRLFNPIFLSFNRSINKKKNVEDAPAFKMPTVWDPIPIICHGYAKTFTIVITTTRDLFQSSGNVPKKIGAIWLALFWHPQEKIVLQTGTKMQIWAPCYYNGSLNGLLKKEAKYFRDCNLHFFSPCK